ncbi:MAG: glutamate dehydrogenase, partial [Bacteroidetes bacterium]|nr:glutamate dehydrogenase [Bacteroidota bacterium]
MSKFLEYLKEKNPGQPEFIQSVEEYYESICPVLENHPKYKHFKIM